MDGQRGGSKEGEGRVEEREPIVHIVLALAGIVLTQRPAGMQTWRAAWCAKPSRYASCDGTGMAEGWEGKKKEGLVVLG